jgi:hypothetical protein
MPPTVFIAYSQDVGALTRKLAAKLEAGGHRVFFDEDSLPPGTAYDDRIRAGVAEADLMVFFISERSTRRPSSKEEGSYALTELSWAKKKWPNPAGRVLPVLLDDDSAIDVPEYLKANVTIFRPIGNAATEIAGEVNRLLEALDVAPPTPLEATGSPARKSPGAKQRTTPSEWAARGVVVLFMAGLFGWFFFQDSRMKRCVSKRLEAVQIEWAQAELVGSRSTRGSDKSVVIRSAAEPELFRLVTQPAVFKVVADCALEHERSAPVLVFNSRFRVETEQRSPVSAAIVRLQELQCTTDAAGSCTMASELRVEPGQTLALVVSHRAFQPHVEQHQASALGQSPVVIFLKKAADAAPALR